MNCSSASFRKRFVWSKKLLQPLYFVNWIWISCLSIFLILSSELPIFSNSYHFYSFIFLQCFAFNLSAFVFLPSILISDFENTEDFNEHFYFLFLLMPMHTYKTIKHCMPILFVTGTWKIIKIKYKSKVSSYWFRQRPI